MEKRYGELQIILEDYVDRKNYIESLTRYVLYFECYKNAFSSIITNIYRLNDGIQREFSGDEEYRYHFSRQPDNANNIIAFLGGRGSGKTTAINEFGRILGTIKNKKEKVQWMRELELSQDLAKYSERDLEFIVLDTIDASLLTDKEDFVELVLAQLYSRIENARQESLLYEKHQDSRSIARIMDKFQDAYVKYHNISKGDAANELGDSVAHILKNMPSGPSVRWAISELLQQFFEFTGYDSRAERYLVITIDDLDLNIKYGYRLLEQIHKYLSDPRIIVLIAADYDQLLRVCKSYFRQQFGRNGEADETDCVEDLSEAYLLKAIPIVNRIYMPDNTSLLKSYTLEENGDRIDRKQLKEFIMGKIAERLGIHYDLNGRKRHFVIPDNVRELVNYNNFLNTLTAFDWEGEELTPEQMQQYDQNHARMNRDIVNRMASQLLNGRQKKMFRQIVEKDIQYRARYAVDLCKNWMEQDYEDRTDGEVYHYGDLLEKLYKLGRKDYRDKALVHCIIAFFTSEMTREYYNVCFGKNRKESQERLQDFLGVSFGNKWLGEIVPSVGLDIEKGFIYELGYNEKAQIRMWEFKGSIKAKANILEAIITSLKENAYFKIIGMFLLLLSDARVSGAPISISKINFQVRKEFKDDEEKREKAIKENSPKNNKFEYNITLDAETAIFDILGFIGKNLSEEEIEELSDSFTDEIRKGINEFADREHMPNAKVPLEKAEKIKKVVKEQLAVWKDNDFFSFPFYNLDIAYNVLKRVRNKRIYEGSKLIGMDDIYGEMKRLYGYIAEELKEEEWKYQDNQIKGQDWHRRFVNSSFIRQFGITYSEEARNSYQNRVESKQENRNMESNGHFEDNFEDQAGNMPNNINRELEHFIKAVQQPKMKDDSPV